MIGPKPTSRILGDAPAEGDSCIFHMIVSGDPNLPPTIDSLALLGPGRDYMDMDAAAKGLINVETEAAKIASTLHGPYATITAALAEFPGAKMEGTAKRMYAAEQARDAHRAAVAEWEAAVDAAGLEPCDRCGGAGGWKGWPGYTCYDCGGRGTQKKHLAAAREE